MRRSRIRSKDTSIGSRTKVDWTRPLPDIYKHILADMAGITVDEINAALSVLDEVIEEWVDNGGAIPLPLAQRKVTRSGYPVIYAEQPECYLHLVLDHIPKNRRFKEKLSALPRVHMLAAISVKDFSDGLWPVAEHARDKMLLEKYLAGHTSERDHWAEREAWISEIERRTIERTRQFESVRAEGPKTVKKESEQRLKKLDKLIDEAITSCCNKLGGLPKNDTILAELKKDLRFISLDNGKGKPYRDRAIKERIPSRLDHFMSQNVRTGLQHRH